MLNEAPTFNENGTIFGGGVTLEQFQSVRDQLLQLRIYEETQQQSNSQTQLNALNQVEGIFSDPTQGCGWSAVGVLQQHQPAFYQSDR